MVASTSSIAAAAANIDPKLAKVTTGGGLMCLICRDSVKGGVKFWTAHANGRQHRSQLSQKTTGVAKSEPDRKRPQESVGRAVPAKRQKATLEATGGDLPSDFFDSKPASNAPATTVKASTSTTTKLVADDYPSSDEEEEQPKGVVPATTSAAQDDQPKSDLPEGFFDDPAKDAKARNVELVDPLEEEMAKFQKALQEESHKSEVIIEVEDEDVNLEREIEELDEQITSWSRLNTLQNKQEAMKEHGALASDVKMEEGEDASDDEDLNVEEISFLDWRRKAT